MVILMVVVIAGALLAGMALLGRPRASATQATRGSDGNVSLMPAFFGDGGSSDCSPGDAGCDGGGGGGGD